jgi:acyl-CoA thioesterase FadM
VDHLGHINNVAAGDILQEGRYRFLTDAGFIINAELRPQLVVASALIEYSADLFAPEPIEVLTGILEIGRTSFVMAQLARQRGRIGLYAHIVEVARDAAGATPLPEPWRARLQGLRIGAPAP